MSDLPGYARAQREYDNRTPSDDGPSECPECSGSKFVDDLDCAACHGFGLIDESGEPFDPHAAEYAADEAADRARDDLYDF